MTLSESPQRRLVEAMGLPLDRCQSASIDLDGSIATVVVTYTLDPEWLRKAVESEQADPLG